MYSFKNDYSEGAHPNILKAMVDSNLEQSAGYGEDEYCERARTYIKKEIGKEEADVHFFVGGTQTNLTAIASFLRPHEAAIAVESGHIATHETGAIEATGHKVITIASENGKLSATLVLKVLEMHESIHMVKPKLVYISNSTEIGTIYTKKELIELKQVCEKHDLIFYMDGARLGSALCAEDNDVTMQDLAKYVDVFYIGATKNGGLMGEALVIINDKLKADFRYLIKQKGALLAKGRLLGIQFEELFKERLFFTIGHHENKMAMKLKKGIRNLGYELMIETTSNQVFPIFPDHIITKLSEQYSFMTWQAIDQQNHAIRLVTSWATSEEAVDRFINYLSTLA